MKLQRAAQIYLVCVRAEGRSKPVARKYRYVLKMFLDIVGDIDVRALTPNHVRNYMYEIPINDPGELRVQAAVLRFFTDWLQVQGKVYSREAQYHLPQKQNGRWLATPRYAAVRRKLPLAL